MALLAFSVEFMPEDNTVKANTAATTTKAMRMMAVSMAVTPLWSRVKVKRRFFMRVLLFDP